MTKTLIGSDPAHTKWCQAQAKKVVSGLRKELGYHGWELMSERLREALVESRVLSLINSQMDEGLPLWRMQELIQVTNQWFQNGLFDD